MPWWKLHNGPDRSQKKAWTGEIRSFHKREMLRSYLVETDALAYARGRAEEFGRCASAELSCLPLSPCRLILEGLTNRVVYRNS